MKTYRLTIKGTELEAVAAAADFGITLSNIRPASRKGEVYADTDAAFERVQQYFCAPSHPPFPAGTLMTYFEPAQWLPED